MEEEKNSFEETVITETNEVSEIDNCATINLSKSSSTHTINSMYVAIKSKVGLLLSNNVSPVFNMIKNNGYGKLIVGLIAILATVFGYITMTLLQSLYLAAMAVNSVRSVKGNTDLKPVVQGWITYSAVMLIFYVLNILSSLTGDVIKFVFETVKFVLLFCLYGSPQLQENINYGMGRVYSCNNRIIDTTQNGINAFISYFYQSCNKENFEDILKVFSKDKEL